MLTDEVRYLGIAFRYIDEAGNAVLDFREKPGFMPPLGVRQRHKRDHVQMGNPKSMWRIPVQRMIPI